MPGTPAAGGGARGGPQVRPLVESNAVEAVKKKVLEQAAVQEPIAAAVRGGDKIAVGRILGPLFWRSR